MAKWSERERRDALRDLAILDTPSEDVLDEIVTAAARALGAPMAAVSLIDEHRQWFKARVGLDVSETPREVSFCAHAVEADALLVVPDAHADPRFAANALVTGDPNLRFYAGAVIRTENGVPVGALCVLDTVARPDGLSDEQISLLQTLADQVSEQLRLRRLVSLHHDVVLEQATELEAGHDREARLMRAFNSGAVGWWEWDVATDLVVGNEDLARDFGLDPTLATGGAPIEVFFGNVHPDDRADLAHAVEVAVATGAPFREEYRLRLPDGQVHWVSARGACLRDEAGTPTVFPGVVIDITERKTAESRLREVDIRRDLAMTAAALGSWDHDPSNGVRRYDARALQMLGLSTAAMKDQENTFGVIHPDDQARVRKASTEALDPKRAGPFRETFRIVDPKTGKIRWLSAIGRSEFAHGVCTRFIGVLDDVTEEKVAEEHRQLLVNELNHRVKNTLAVVASIVDASLRGAGDLAAAREEVGRRLNVFGKAHDLLTAERWTSAEVKAVAENAIQSISLSSDRIELAGPAVRLGPKPALQLALALHELATNAVKYGALSNDTGRVSLTWSVSDDTAPIFQASWIERGGPPVATPTRRGFGTRLIEAATAAEFQGTSRLDYAPSGLRWSLEAPLADLETSGRAEPDIGGIT